MAYEPMLTAADIEEGNYSKNEVADLMMRLEIAQRALVFIAETLKVSNGEDKFVFEAYQVAINEHQRSENTHSKNCDGEVTLRESGQYTCMCDLIASHDN